MYFRHRHVPRSVYKAAKQTKVMRAAIRRKYVFNNYLLEVFFFLVIIYSCHKSIKLRFQGSCVVPVRVFPRFAAAADILSPVS